MFNNPLTGIPPGCKKNHPSFSRWCRREGLNHRLTAKIPTGIERTPIVKSEQLPSCLPHAGGIASVSRWLSPSGRHHRKNPPESSRTLAGCHPPFADHALHLHQPPLPSHFCDQKPRAHPRKRMAAGTPFVSRRHCQRSRWATRRSRWRRRSRSSVGFAQIFCLPSRFHARIQKIVFLVVEGIEMPRLSLARRICRF